jgi:hypothetical protein
MQNKMVPHNTIHSYNTAHKRNNQRSEKTRFLNRSCKYRLTTFSTNFGIQYYLNMHTHDTNSLNYLIL